MFGRWARWQGLAADRAMKRFTEAKLYEATGLYFPTRVRPSGEVNGSAGRWGNVIESGLTPIEGVGVQLHEDAHVFWRDVARNNEPVVNSELRADATAGYWMVMSDLPFRARGAYIALLRSFGEDQGDHGTARDRVRSFQAGLRAAERDLELGREQGTGLDQVLESFALQAPRVFRPGVLRYADAVQLAYAWGR